MSYQGTPLAGRTALVTGAARGLGRAYALRLASLGADVAVLDADLHSYAQFEAEAKEMTADSTMSEIEALGRRSIGLEVDVTDAGAMSEAIASIGDAWGRLDVVVCNAGGGTGTPAETKAADLPPELFDLVVKRNLYGTVNTCRPASAIMRRQGSGRIVTVSSQAGRHGAPDGGYAHYGTAKAGIQMYTRYLAQQLGPDNITVNCIAPGYIGTGRLNVQFDAIGRETVENAIALRRIGTPDDCANVIEFLVTDLGSYVTGAIIPIDGGSVS